MTPSRGARTGTWIHYGRRGGSQSSMPMQRSGAEEGCGHCREQNRSAASPCLHGFQNSNGKLLELREMHSHHDRVFHVRTLERLQRVRSNVALADRIEALPILKPHLISIYQELVQ